MPVSVTLILDEARRPDESYVLLPESAWVVVILPSRVTEVCFKT